MTESLADFFGQRACIAGKIPLDEILNRTSTTQPKNDQAQQKQGTYKHQ